MNNKEWISLNCHMKCKLVCNKEIKSLETFPTKENIKSLKSDVVYKLPFTCIAVSIIDFDEKQDEVGKKVWAKILSEFVFGISKIMKSYNAKFIRLHDDFIYGLFDTRFKEDVDSVLDCCVDINTFKIHLNKQIDKLLFEGSMKCDKDDVENIIDYGIGAFFSLNNYVSIALSGPSRTKEILFTGDAINWANKLSKLSNTEEYDPILFNQLVFTNLSQEFKEDNEEIWDLTPYNDLYKHERIYGCDWIFPKYLNWIKNNS